MRRRKLILINGIMTTMNKSPILIALAFLAGCFSVVNTFPTYEPGDSSPRGNDVSVGFSGNLFRMKNVTSVDGAVYSVGNAYGTKNQFYTGTGLYSGQAYSWQEVPFEAKIIADRLEDCGFIVRAPQPKYILDVEDFYKDCEPPSDCSMGDFLAVYLPTLTFAGRTDKCYPYKVKIYDAATGKVLYSRVHNFRGHIISVQLIPIFYCCKSAGWEYLRQWMYIIADDVIKQLELLEGKSPRSQG